MKQWSLALAHMSDDDRRRVLDLADVVLGADIFGFPDRSIWRFLAPYMLKTEHGRYYLADPMQRLLLRVCVGVRVCMYCVCVWGGVITSPNYRKPKPTKTGFSFVRCRAFAGYAALLGTHCHPSRHPMSLHPLQRFA